MLKKAISVAVALMMSASLFAVPAMAEESSEGAAIGVLSYLAISEDDYLTRVIAEHSARDYLREQGVIESAKEIDSLQEIVFYDSLDAMLMGLTSGEVTALSVPDCTARYLCAANDQVEQADLYHPENAEGFTQDLLDRICNGYSFMMLEDNSELRDQFEQAIDEMKADGTLDELIQTYITDVAESGETEAVEFEQFDGEPIKVAVTGALPPMDYVAADGTPAGFNTAVLAEVGKRLEKNIELVQVDSVGRALALSQGNVDAVFWTRGMPKGSFIEDGLALSEEELETYIQEKRENATEEELTMMDGLSGSLPTEVYRNRDIPEGTVNTAPYYTDMNVLVTLK